MPKLPAHQTPEAKLDTAAGFIDAALTSDQKRGAFEKPGQVVYAIVALTSTSYTGHADGEEKPPVVKFRITECEVARTTEDAAALVEARRAMYRGRQIDGTFDEVGQGPMRPDASLDGLMASKPSEDELREYKRRREQERQDEYVR